MPPERPIIRRSARGAQQVSRLSTLVDTLPYYRPSSEAGGKLVDSLTKMSLDEATDTVRYGSRSAQHRTTKTKYHHSPMISGHHKSTVPAFSSSPPPLPGPHFQLFPVPYPGHRQPYNHRTSRKYAVQDPQLHDLPTLPNSSHALGVAALSPYLYTDTASPVRLVPSPTVLPTSVPVPSFDLSAIKSCFPSPLVSDPHPQLHINDVAAQIISQNINPGGGTLQEALWGPVSHPIPWGCSRSAKDDSGLERRMSRISLEDPKALRAHAEHVHASLEHAGKARSLVNFRSKVRDTTAANVSAASARIAPAVTHILPSPYPIQQAIESAQPHAEDATLVSDFQRITLQDANTYQRRLSVEPKGVDKQGSTGNGDHWEYSELKAYTEVDDDDKDDENIMTARSLLMDSSRLNLPGFGPDLVACVANYLAPSWGEHPDTSTSFDDDMYMSVDDGHATSWFSSSEDEGSDSVDAGDV